MNFKKLGYYAVVTCLVSFLGRAIITAGFQMIGESGVSQEVVNAIVGTLGVAFGYYVIAYFIFKTGYFFISELVKPHET